MQMQFKHALCLISTLALQKPHSRFLARDQKDDLALHSALHPHYNARLSIPKPKPATHASCMTLGHVFTTGYPPLPNLVKISTLLQILTAYLTVASSSSSFPLCCFCAFRRAPRRAASSCLPAAAGPL